LSISKLAQEGNMPEKNIAEKIRELINGSKCETCPKEECLGSDCDGCLTDCILALIASEQQPMVEALKDTLGLIDCIECDKYYNEKTRLFDHDPKKCDHCLLKAKIDAALAKGEGK
jgi:hypothetical protein